VVEEVQMGLGRVVKIRGIKSPGMTATVLLRGSNKLVIDEAYRSLRDALCVVRCLVHKPYLVPGGAACEVEVARHLMSISKELPGTESYCMSGFARALELIPYTLAENAGFDPIQLMTTLRVRHETGHKYDGIDVRNGRICNMCDQRVFQPSLVTASAINLASECVRMILKIDGIIKTPH